MSAVVAVQVLQSVLDAAGPESARIERLWWLMFWVATVVFVLVVAAATVGFLRGRERRLRDATAPSPHGRAEQPFDTGATPVVAGAVVATVVTLFVLLVATVWTHRAVASLGASTAVSIKVTGHQWWWEVQYESADPSTQFTTANEIHIPVGHPVVLKITSTDVIHSIWIPNLQGKRDLVPGYVNTLWLEADRPGLYRGQCAEFCGLQHAHMALYVTAESDADFEKWKIDQLKPAPQPATDEERHGRDVFLHATCNTCHTIRGTIAGAVMGPDLTHLASRGTIAAGTLPNTRGHLGGWIADPQQIKPGNYMPPNSLQGEDLQALLTYLESLK
jgi:cytochrome c oxidase subunit II